MTATKTRSSDYTMARDSFDTMVYDNARAAYPEIQSVQDQAENDHGAGELVADLHAALYKTQPKINPNGRAPVAHFAAMEAMLNCTEYEQIRASTELNEVATGLALPGLANRMVEHVAAASGKGAAMDPDTLRRAVRRMLRAVEGEVGEALGAAQALLGDVSPTETDLSHVLAARDAIRDSGKLRKIADLAGRMRRLALRKHKDRPRHGPDEIVDVELGGEITRLLPSELALLRHPILRKDVLRRLLNREALQYRMQTNEPQAKGPIVCMLDESGSMRGAREVWSKAVALGLCAIALEDRRDVYMISFAGTGVMRETFFPGGTTASVADLVASLERFFGGDTDFQTPLDRALEVVGESRWSKADLVMVTDGDNGIDESWAEVWKKKRNERETRLWTVLIGTRAKDLEAISDGVARLRDAGPGQNDEEALELVFGF